METCRDLEEFKKLCEMNDIIHRAIVQNWWLKACKYKNKELELQANLIKTHLETIIRLNKENEILKKCAEFYADENNWDVVCMRADGEDNGAPVFCDPEYYRARMILKEIEDLK